MHSWHKCFRMPSLSLTGRTNHSKSLWSELGPSLKKLGNSSFRRHTVIRELKQPRRKGRRRRQVIAEGLERGRRFWRENETQAVAQGRRRVNSCLFSLCRFKKKASFSDIQNLLLLSHGSNFVQDDEFFLLL